MSFGSSVTLAAERIVRPVQEMHRAIAGQWFRLLGPVGRPVHVAHDLISGLVYKSIRASASALGVGLDAKVAADSPSAHSAQAVVNGLWGDALGRHERRLGTSMSFRDPRATEIPGGPDLVAVRPAATGHLVVLVHGLAQTERCWLADDTRPGLLNALEDHPRLTALALRYNSGLPVGENGTRLASLLEEVLERWPVPVQSIALVGNSMGGLVVRSACAAALRAEHRWVEEVGDLVTIGSPHRGAPLEKAVTAAAWALGVAPQTRPLSDFLNSRSQGIKDLRWGSIGIAPDDEPGVAALLSGVNHHFVAGVVTSDPVHPVGALVGDLIVRPESSTRAPALEASSVAVLGGVRHFDLIRDPAVLDRVMGWLADPLDG